MAGDSENPRVWLEADVYVADLSTTAPTDVSAAWPAGWEPIGLLSEDGMTEGRDETQTDHYAWGGVLVRTTRARHKRTFTITALEDNPAVFDLVNPGSTAETTTGVTTREVTAPGPNPKAFGFELRDGDTIRRLVVPRGEVLSPGQISSSESAMT